MAIYTFGIPEAAGMIARLDAEGGGGVVLVVGSSLREANELVDALLDALLASSVSAVIRKSHGRLGVELPSGVRVRAISGDGVRGRTARLGILIPGVKHQVVRDLHCAVLTTGGSLLAVNLPTSAAAPTEPAPDAEPTQTQAETETEAK